MDWYSFVSLLTIPALIQGGRSSAAKRVNKELIYALRDTPKFGSVIPKDDNFMKWEAVIMGPQGSPYDGGVFFLNVEFPNDYPYVPPTVKFTSNMFHPNIYVDGTICLDIMQYPNWSPAYTAVKLLYQVEALLEKPNTDCIANKHAAQMYKEDYKQYEKLTAATGVDFS